MGIDLGITNFTVDSNGVAVSPAEVSEELERIEKRHRVLCRKKHGLKNCEEARRRLAEPYERVRNRFTDFRETFAAAYTRTFDAVFLEDLNVRELLRSESNGRNVRLMS